MEHYPRIHQFAIGEIRDEFNPDPTLVAILKRSQRTDADNVGVTEQLDPIFGLIENMGTTDFTFLAKESSNNNDDEDGPADPYAGVNIRIAGSSVASVVVKPGGKVAFSLELATELYVRFQATTGHFGRLTICHFFGQLERREKEGTV